MKRDWRTAGAIAFTLFSFVLVGSIFAGVANYLRGEGKESVIGYVAFLVFMFAISGAVLFSRVANLPGKRVGGGAFHPRVDLFPDEAIETDVVASYAPGGLRLARGRLFLTNTRLIFVPTVFPSLLKLTSVPSEPLAISFERVLSASEERHVNPMLGLLGLMAPALVIKLLDGSEHAFWLKDRVEVLALLRRHVA